MKGLLSLMALLFLLASCGHRKDAKHFEKILEAQTGQDHSIAKLHTETGKYVVFKNEVTGEYSAYNMDKLDRKKMDTYDQFLAVAADGVDIVKNLERHQEWIESGYWQDEYDYYIVYYDYWDDWCECWQEDWYYESYYVGSYWVDTSHWYTYYTGGGFRFSNTQGPSKDLETLAALKEDVQEKVIAKTLESEFALSGGRSAELAKLVTRYQKLESSRELTSSEKDVFALDALGVSYSNVENALKLRSQGDNSGYSSLLEAAAKVNKTTPEQIGKFFNEFVEEAL